jgi:hypothetical protein
VRGLGGGCSRLGACKARGRSQLPGPDGGCSGPGRTRAPAAAVAAPDQDAACGPGAGGAPKRGAQRGGAAGGRTTAGEGRDERSARLRRRHRLAESEHQRDVAADAVLLQRLGGADALPSALWGPGQEGRAGCAVGRGGGAGGCFGQRERVPLSREEMRRGRRRCGLSFGHMRRGPARAPLPGPPASLISTRLRGTPAAS